MRTSEFRDRGGLALGRRKDRRVPTNVDGGREARQTQHDRRDDAENVALTGRTKPEDQAPHHRTKVSARTHNARHGASRFGDDVRDDTVQGSLRHSYPERKEDEDGDGCPKFGHKSKDLKENSLPNKGGPLRDIASTHAGDARAKLAVEKVCDGYEVDKVG